MKRIIPILCAGLIAVPTAHADTWTVDGVDYPTCIMEDGSDAVSLPCIWTDQQTGVKYLTFTEFSLPIERR